MVLSWQNLVGGSASIILLLLIVPYIKTVMVGTTRPSAVSWIGWALLFAIETAAQASKGLSWSLAIPLISTCSTTIIAITALRMGRVVWTRADYFCITLAAAAVMLWALTSEPLFALVLSIVADLAVTIPSVIKTYHEPDSEPFFLWAIYTGACVLAVVATSPLTIYNLLVPVYTILGSLAIVVFARGRTSFK
ncbi:MAG: hypothetical protein ACREGR_02280 [Minisyncoccia bacterium]